METIGDAYYDSSKLKVGSKIKFREEKQSYKVMASNVAFAVCTKPFNCQHTTLYTVIDWRSKIRGTENLIFPLGAETLEQCQEMLQRLTDGASEVSYRNNIPLDIEKYIPI